MWELSVETNVFPGRRGEKGLASSWIRVSTAVEPLRDTLECPGPGTVADRGGQTAGYLEFSQNLRTVRSFNCLIPNSS